MAEEICIFTKESVIIKPPKKSPALSRIIVLVIATVCSLYICSISLKQTKTSTNSKLSNIEVIERPCHEYGVDRSQIPYLHYPNPKTFSRAECACNPVRLFAIVSMQRSGSGWFETLLNSHVNMSSNGEIFSVKERRDNISSIMTTLNRVYNLDCLPVLRRISAQLQSASSGCLIRGRSNLSDLLLSVGLMEHHKDIAEYFNDQCVSVIFLFRRNLLRRMVSLLANSYDRYAKVLNGTHKSHVHSPEEAVSLSRYKPIINSTSLTMELKQMEETAVKALEYFSSTRHIILYYEDLVKNLTKLADVQHFLGLPEMVLTSRQVKIHKGPLSEHIKNWDIINKTLRGTAYERFLRADY